VILVPQEKALSSRKCLGCLKSEGLDRREAGGKLGSAFSKGRAAAGTSPKGLSPEFKPSKGSSPQKNFLRGLFGVRFSKYHIKRMDYRVHQGSAPPKIFFGRPFCHALLSRRSNKTTQMEMNGY
jgi:hypothetical protein